MRLSLSINHTTPAKRASAPTIHNVFCRPLSPRLSTVSTCVVVSPLCRLLSCEAMLSTCRSAACPVALSCRSTLCDIVCVCHPASALRRVWVVSRLSGGVPVAGSTGLSVSYTRSVVTTSSPLACSVIVEVSVCPCKTSCRDTAAAPSVTTLRSDAVCRSELFVVCWLAVVAFFVGEQFARHRALVSKRAARYLLDGLAKSLNVIA